MQKFSLFLRDKLVDRLTFSMKIYRRGVSEPTTFSIQSERNVDGNWNKFSLGDQKSGAPQSRETLKEQLASIEERVRKYIVDNAMEVGWTECEALIKEKLKSGLSAEDMEYQSELPIYAIAAYGYEAHFYAPIMATTYAIEGAEAFAKNDLDRLSHCVDRGLHWSNPDMFVPNPKDRFTERASEGGNGKARRYELIKDKVAELLMKRAPVEGWASTSAAIKTIVDELIDCHFSFVEECGLTPENLPRSIGEWIQVDPKRFPHRIKFDI